MAAANAQVTPDNVVHLTRPIPQSAAKILEDLEKDRGPVETGTIIRWTSVHPGTKARFDYAAIFAGGVWYTSAPNDNSNVQRMMKHEELVSYLNKKKANIEDVKVAVDFVTLNW